MRFLSVLAFLFLSSSLAFAGLEQGASVPSVTVKDDAGQDWTTTDQKGWLVVYFYPAAMTGGCTKQACSYRDGIKELEKNDITVVGVSGDEVKNLAAFKKMHNLNFPLLSDFKGELAKAFGVPTKKGGTIQREVDGKSMDLLRGLTTSRWTYVISPDKKVVKVFEKVNPKSDYTEVLKVVKSNS